MKLGKASPGQSGAAIKQRIQKSAKRTRGDLRGRGNSRSRRENRIAGHSKRKRKKHKAKEAGILKSEKELAGTRKNPKTNGA